MARIRTAVACTTRDRRHVVDDGDTGGPFCVQCGLLVIVVEAEPDVDSWWPLPLAGHADKVEAVRLLTARDGAGCFYCDRELLDIETAPVPVPGGALPADYPTIDHIVPRALGGGSQLGNLALACPRCNRLKGHQFHVLLDMVHRVRIENRFLIEQVRTANEAERTRTKPTYP